MYSIAIIGSGPTGVYTARYLLSLHEALVITIFESQAQAGKGTPYHQDWNEKEMLSNIASIEIPPVTETLMQWLWSRTDHELSKMGVMRTHINEREFFPRVALGEYFHAQLEKLMGNAYASHSVLAVKTSHKVLDVRVVENGIELEVRDNTGKIHCPVFDYVIMATGHAWPRETEVRPGYFLSPWPASALRTIDHCHIGIRGTSLSAIDALVALSVRRGSFRREANGELKYLPEPGTEAFHATIMSRKGILPEADFYYPIPYTSLQICTKQAVEKLINSISRPQLLDAVFALFKAEIIACDPDYSKRIGLKHLTLEKFYEAYFHERQQYDPFFWATKNLAEAKANQERKHTVAWSYAILRMHEVIAHVVPQLSAEDYQRFNNYFRHIFIDNYATVPHESIERLLSLHRAGKLDILKLDDDYILDTKAPVSGVYLTYSNKQIYFPAFIEATGQRPLSVHEFPFKGLWEQGLIDKATAPCCISACSRQNYNKPVDIGGIGLDLSYHPLSDSPYAARLYCLSLPFLLGQFPFSQGITSSHDMGKKVAQDMAKQLSMKNMSLPYKGKSKNSEPVY